MIPKNSLNRRNFLKYSAFGVASLCATKLLRSDGIAFAADPVLKPLTSDDPTGKVLGYSADAKKVDVKKWPKKAGPGGDAQSCTSCQFFTKLDDKSGKCQIFPMNTVASGGWCSSWTKKA
jgi:hypothetical protein